MASPFPGMDPYLEHPARWPGVHDGLISAVRAQLNAVLPPGYVADIGERVYLVLPSRGIAPDVFVTRAPAPEPLHAAARAGTSISLAERSAEPWAFTVEPIEVRETFIEILAAAEESRVITVLEVLSPANKAPGSAGRELYLRKQHEVLQSDASLVEIDLLRYGEHTVAPPVEYLQRQGTWDYLVCRHRAWALWAYEAWPIRLREKLPVISIPLAQEDPEVNLDLQAAFDRNYDEGAYERRVDYSEDAYVPLPPEDAAWADALLRQRGMRT